jgi:hypothetical protein
MLPQLIMGQIQKLLDILFKQEGTEKAKKPSHATYCPFKRKSELNKKECGERAAQ